MAKIYLQRDAHLEEAARLLKRYLTRWPEENRPSWADAHWRLGQVYQKQGKAKQAEQEWKKAIQLNPEHNNAKQALERLGK